MSVSIREHLRKGHIILSSIGACVILLGLIEILLEVEPLRDFKYTVSEDVIYYFIFGFWFYFLTAGLYELIYYFIHTKTPKDTWFVIASLVLGAITLWFTLWYTDLVHYEPIPGLNFQRDTWIQVPPLYTTFGFLALFNLVVWFYIVRFILRAIASIGNNRKTMLITIIAIVFFIIVTIASFNPESSVICSEPPPILGCGYTFGWPVVIGDRYYFESNGYINEIYSKSVSVLINLIAAGIFGYAIGSIVSWTNILKIQPQPDKLKNTIN